ncbi:ZPR1 zinc finger domain-containing protein [Candidatus Woesearchaeota archaeon]|nr:ZPR1 zinc finger domain-containing protein [Candidatus Woesearchaeota archaeon]MCF7901622.1 ZPR1 zinc finger domain-containing protein [Candidatus Woesearchaeota archaeon]
MTAKDGEMEVLEGEHCPFCNKKTLTLRQAEREVPFFGNLIIFSMDCENDDCGYHKADVEAAESKSPIKASIEVSSEEDLRVRVVKSSTATIKIAHVGSIEPGETSNGYVTNIEGILNRMKVQVEKVRDSTDDDAEKKKAKNIIKKLTKVMMGSEKITISLEDPNGNSAIISEKTVIKGKK